MGMVMYPFSPRELAALESDAKPKKEWVRRGCFKQKPMPPKERMLRANSARLWLSSVLHAGPLPAREVLQRAKLEGFSEWGVRRAKAHLGVKTVKVGGTYRGWGAQWVWQISVSN
jgi:hypothetical protein